MKKIITLLFVLALICLQALAQNSSPYWSLTGNNNETGTSKLGTTNSISLHFYTNNSQRMYIDSANGRVGIGTTAPQDRLHVNSSSGENPFRAQVNGTTRLLIFNNGGTALGANAVPPVNGLYVYGNTGLGNNAPAYKLEVKGDIAIDSGVFRITGDPVFKYNTPNQSIALGNAGGTGTRLNTAVGYNALINNTTGQDNVAVGHKTLYNDNIGYSNIAIGSHALYNNKTSNNLVAIGDSAMFNTNGVFNNTAIGSKALYTNTTGYSNTAVGYQALLVNTTGAYNTSMGVYTLSSNSTGSYNTSLGNGGLESNTTGSNNTALGYSSLVNNTTTSDNTAIGYQALYSNSQEDANRNTAVGENALYNNTEGQSNTAVGTNAAINNTDGDQNTSIGYYALGNYSGSNNTGLGSFADMNGTGYIYSTAIGWGATATASGQVRVGDNSVSSIGGYANWTNISDGRVKKNIKQNVPGLSFINKLQPVTYNLDLEAADNIVKRPAIKDKAGNVINQSKQQTEMRTAKQQVVYTGFVAQDVEKAAKDMNYDFSGVDAPKNEKDLYGLRYAEFVVPLVKAVQELSKQNDSLQKQINQLQSLIAGSGGSNGSFPSIATKSVTLSSAALFQNAPNPFTKNTTIQYSLPSGYSNALIVITDKAGKTLKSVALNGSSSGTLQVEASTLASGAYQYALIIDGSLVDTKQMIRVK